MVEVSSQQFQGYLSRIVMITWIDSAFSPEGWVMSEESQEPDLDPIFTVGLLIHEDDNCVIVTNSDALSCRMSPLLIPRVAITSREDINADGHLDRLLETHRKTMAGYDPNFHDFLEVLE